MAMAFNLGVKDQILVFACQMQWVQTTAELQRFQSLLGTKVSESMNDALTLVLNKLEQFFFKKKSKVHSYDI